MTAWAIEPGNPPIFYTHTHTHTHIYTCTYTGGFRVSITHWMGLTPKNLTDFFFYFLCCISKVGSLSLCSFISLIYFSYVHFFMCLRNVAYARAPPTKRRGLTSLHFLFFCLHQTCCCERNIHARLYFIQFSNFIAILACIVPTAGPSKNVYVYLLLVQTPHFFFVLLRLLCMSKCLLIFFF